MGIQMKRYISSKILFIVILVFSVNAIAEIIEIGSAKTVTGERFLTIIQLKYDPKKVPASLESTEKYVHAAYFNGIHWIRLPNSNVQPAKQIVEVPVSHPGPYRVVYQSEPYGLKATESPNSKDNKYLLLIPGIATSRETWQDLKRYFSPKGYSFLEFDYPPGEKIEKAAEYLSAELNKLHQTHGDFRFNIIAMGIGGLIANYYYGQDDLYQRDIDKLIVCLGTPYRDSKMADLETVSTLYKRLMKRKKQGLDGQTIHLLFSFYDALGELRLDLKNASHLMDKVCGIQADRFQDSIRMEAFSGIKPWKFGFLPEDIQNVPELLDKQGDGYVSLESSRWTPIERVPFELNHHELPKSNEVFRSIEGFLELEKFNWTVLFNKIADPAIRKKIAQLWYQEINLYYQDPHSIEFFINYNQNILRSVPEDALLFTNGDMDTFPALYLQEIENFRKDVAVINVSLFNLPEYIKYLKHAFRLPTGLSDAKIEKLKLKKNNREFVRSGGIHVPLTDKKTLRIQDIMLLNVVETNKWKRPIYFAVTVEKNNLLFPEDYFQFEGLVRRLHSEKVMNQSNESVIIDNFFNKYTFEGPFDTQGNLKPETEPFIAELAMNYMAPLLKLTHDEIENQNFENAENYLSFAKRFKSTDSAAFLKRMEKLLASKKGTD